MTGGQLVGRGFIGGAAWPHLGGAGPGGEGVRLGIEQIVDFASVAEIVTQQLIFDFSKSLIHSTCKPFTA